MKQIPQHFFDWGTSLSGCDGGNINADIWLCGIEWGGGTEDDSYYQRLKSEILKGKVQGEEKSFDWIAGTSFPYGKTFAKLFCAIKGDNLFQYNENISSGAWNGSELFKLNLYPIAFDNTDPVHWKIHKMDEITGFSQKHLFQLWCMTNRFPSFHRIAQKHKPKLIIGTGISYLKEFYICFGGLNQENQIIKEETIEDTEGRIRIIYWMNVNKETTLIVIPFLSGRYGLNSNSLIENTGIKIREILKSEGRAE